MSSFFTVPSSQRKRKRSQISDPTRKRTITSSSKRKPQPTQADDDDSIASGSESGSAAPEVDDVSSEEDSDPGETAASRRLKLAEQYLENIRQEVGEDQEGEVGFDAADVDRELIAARLKEDVDEEKGKLHRYIAQKLDLGKASSTRFRADTLATTAVAACAPYVYTASKDMRLLKWELPNPETQSTTKQPHPAKTQRQTRRKPKLLLYTSGNKNHASKSYSNDDTYQHHTAPILCVAASSDGKFLASGGADRKLIIWSAPTLTPLKVFHQHRDSVTSLAFRGKTNQLFSASKDRTVKIWALDELAYVETLFGHQDEVVDVSAVGGSQERCVSVGARDRTARLWKVVEESQLVFRGGGAGTSASKDKKHKFARGRQQKGVADDTPTHEVGNKPTFNEGTLDRVTQIDTALFVTGSDSGALSLFSLHKKKPLHVFPLAHGWDDAPPDSNSSADVEPSEAEAMTIVNGKPAATTSEPETEIQLGIKTFGPQAPLTLNGHSSSGHNSNGHSSSSSALSNAFNAQPTPRWITALRCIPYTDLFVTGSWDGFVRLWRQTSNEGGESRRIEVVGVLGAGGSSGGEAEPLKGIINDLAVFLREPSKKAGTKGGVTIVAAVGNETRLGRWMRKGGRKANGGVVWDVPFA